eukprot:5777746-Pleurochrysis_carterae.AAC.2
MAVAADICSREQQKDGMQTALGNAQACAAAHCGPRAPRWRVVSRARSGGALALEASAALRPKRIAKACTRTPAHGNLATGPLLGSRTAMCTETREDVRSIRSEEKERLNEDRRKTRKNEASRDVYVRSKKRKRGDPNSVGEGWL